MQAPAPRPPSVEPSEDFAGHYGPAFQQRPYYGAHARAHPQQYSPAYYPGANQVVPYNGYAPNPFSPMANNANGSGYFGPEPARPMYDVMAYQHGYYAPAQYNHLLAQMQQMHLAHPGPPVTEASGPAASPAPREVDIEKIRLEAQIVAFKAQEDKQKAALEARELAEQIRRETEDALVKKMEEMRKQQEESQRQIEAAKAEADKAAVARMETEQKAAEERARLEAEALKRAEENALRKFEAEMKAAEERAKREKEERARIEAEAKARFEAALKADADAKAAAEKKAAEEAERLKMIHEDARRKAELEYLAKVEAEKEAAEEAAKEHEALKKIEDEAKASLEDAKKKDSGGTIKFKDAVGRKFSFPFHLCQTWHVRAPDLLGARRIADSGYAGHGGAHQAGLSQRRRHRTARARGPLRPDRAQQRNHPPLCVGEGRRARVVHQHDHVASRQDTSADKGHASPAYRARSARHAPGHNTTAGVGRARVWGPTSP